MDALKDKKSLKINSIYLLDFEITAQIWNYLYQLVYTTFCYYEIITSDNIFI